jgi:hypothetical protein
MIPDWKFADARMPTENEKQKVSGWLTEDDLDQRARRASREKYDAALAQVPDASPVPGDEL